MKSALAAWKRLRVDFDRSTACLYLLHRLLQSLSGGRAGIVAYALYAQPLGNAELAAMRPDAGTRVERWPPHDARGRALPRPAPVLRQRWDEGARCYGAEVKGDVAGCIWIATGPAHDEDEIRCRYRLPADGVWDFDVWIAPRWRLGRTLARLWGFVDAELSAEGKRWSFSRISRFNPGSVAAHTRLGAQPIGRFTALRWGRLELHWPSTGLPRLSLQRRFELPLNAPSVR